jgi:hypothetical protein
MTAEHHEMTLRIPRDLKIKLRAEAFERRLSQNKIVELALIKYLRQPQQDGR